MEQSDKHKLCHQQPFTCTVSICVHGRTHSLRFVIHRTQTEYTNIGIQLQYNGYNMNIYKWVLSSGKAATQRHVHYPRLVAPVTMEGEVTGVQ